LRPPEPVFADTSYWIARFSPGDEWAIAAERAVQELGPVQVITTDEILVEFLASVSGGTPNIRRAAVLFVEGIMGDPHITVIPQSRESFMKGLELYGSRPDKHYSLVDCISMRTMRDRGLNWILTSDDHFRQDGFTILMKK
jgi:uncharacterized protein